MGSRAATDKPKPTRSARTTAASECRERPAGSNVANHDDKNDEAHRMLEKIIAATATPDIALVVDFGSRPIDRGYGKRIRHQQTPAHAIPIHPV